MGLSVQKNCKEERRRRSGGSFVCSALLPVLELQLALKAWGKSQLQAQASGKKKSTQSPATFGCGTGLRLCTSSEQVCSCAGA